VTRRTLLVSALAPRDCVVVLDTASGATVRCDNERAASGRALPPGSAVKPLSLAAFYRRERVRCTGHLSIGGRRLDCIHPPLDEPLDAEAALAMSCNSWFAAMARLADPAELASTLSHAGAEAARAHDVAGLQLQALGLERVRFTPLALATAYRRIALHGEAVVRTGLRRAAEQGTAQLARPEGLAIAGKTGTANGAAWFAGFAPADAPRVVVVVQLTGGRGGADAAPLAREVFARWRASH